MERTVQQHSSSLRGLFAKSEALQLIAQMGAALVPSAVQEQRVDEPLGTDPVPEMPRT